MRINRIRNRQELVSFVAEQVKEDESHLRLLQWVLKEGKQVPESILDRCMIVDAGRDLKTILAMPEWKTLKEMLDDSTSDDALKEYRERLIWLACDATSENDDSSFGTDMRKWGLEMMRIVRLIDLYLFPEKHRVMMKEQYGEDVEDDDD